MKFEKTEIPKPHSEVYRPEITRLPRLTWWRRLFRYFVHWCAKILVWIWTKIEINGLENLPSRGPALIVSNHLGDADVVTGIAYTPMMVEALAKAELYDFPLLGWLMDTYGVIWVHRGRPDRKALRAALRGLAEGRMIALAPEGRESLTGGLERGAGGAAYLALKSNAPIVPVAFTGTENKRVFRNLPNFRRTEMTITVGLPLRLEKLPSFKESIRNGTDRIMTTLAALLPPTYQGVYGSSAEE